MRVIPVVLERSLLAGLLGLPALALLGLIANEGEVGLVFAGLVLVGGLVYVGVVWLLLRRQLRRMAEGAEPAPPEAVVEPLGLTALRSGLKALLGLAVAWVWGSVTAPAILVGFALYTALGALTLSRHERRAGHRLVRMKGEPGRFRAF